MALKRPMLKGMGLTEEQVDAIIEAHTETVNALKEERDKLKEDAEALVEEKKKTEALQKKVQELENASAEESSYKTKYEDTQKEYNEYKKGVEAENTKRSKTDALKSLLKEIGIPEKRLDRILKVSEIDKIKLDKDGKIEDSDKLKTSLKEEWGEFIVTEGSKGANTEKPPAGNGDNGAGEHYAAKRAMQQRAALYGEIKNSKEE